MVRFKNRHILVEFLQPSQLSPAFNATSLAIPNETEAGDEDEDFLQQIPDIPFLLPIPSANGSESRLRLGDEGGGAVYRAIRGTVQDVYGDEGWGRISSSFKVIYHSPLTTLTILRISRSHYRLLWSAVTLITNINGNPVLPRVVAVSGTIRKLQNAAIVYHRNVTARVLAVSVDGKGPMERGEETKRLDNAWEKERTQIGGLED